ncbi:hypothetical protein [Piscinibacter terrae]|uniref:hypothetical protein n=1 Tax=Piscinibacter terrae TaxID=2496871 RepID=UPI000F5A707C|nr:hypothetical protein [Albitalea terrae]
MFEWLRKSRRTAEPPALPVGSERLSELFRISAEGPGPGHYGMWFSSPGDEAFSASSTLACIDRIYEAVSGVEEFALAEILRCLGAIDGDAKRVPLPEESAVFPVVGKQGERFLVSASKEKGIRFHFPRATTAAIRTAVLNAFGNHLEARRVELQESASRLQPSGSDIDTEWWSSMKQVARGLEEKGEPLRSMGTIVYDS